MRKLIVSPMYQALDSAYTTHFYVELDIHTVVDDVVVATSTEYIYGNDRGDNLGDLTLDILLKKYACNFYSHQEGDLLNNIEDLVSSNKSFRILQDEEYMITCLEPL